MERRGEERKREMFVFEAKKKTHRETNNKKQNFKISLSLSKF